MAADQNREFNPKVSIFKLNDGSQLRDLSPYIISLSGLPGEFDMKDTSTWGSVGERPSVGIQKNHFTVKFLFNMITSVGVATVLNAMWVAQQAGGMSARAFEYYPAGTTSGNTKISGSCFLASLDDPSDMGSNAVLVQAEFQVDNGVTVGTA